MDNANGKLLKYSFKTIYYVILNKYKYNYKIQLPIEKIQFCDAFYIRIFTFLFGNINYKFLHYKL